MRRRTWIGGLAVAWLAVSPGVALTQPAPFDATAGRTVAEDAIPLARQLEPFDATVRRTVAEAEAAAKGTQKGWADHLGLNVIEKNTLSMELVLLPPGKFSMGSPDLDAEAQNREKPHHTVTLTQALYVGKTEVTQGQWEAVMRTTPWRGKGFAAGANYPATYVSWEDAMEFCRKLSAQEKKTYRLPTEAEWEYACRAGTNTKYHFGDDANLLENYAWYQKNTRNKGKKFAHLVGRKRLNGFGLHDMHGNVSEWCGDWHEAQYYETSPGENPTGPAVGSVRVNRGGCWLDSPPDCRSAYRRSSLPAWSSYGIGLRVVRER